MEKNGKVKKEKIYSTHVSPLVYLIMDAWWHPTVQKVCFLLLSHLVFPSQTCAQ